jgi:hypothetical protein
MGRVAGINDRFQRLGWMAAQDHRTNFPSRPKAGIGGPQKAANRRQRLTEGLNKL